VLNLGRVKLYLAAGHASVAFTLTRYVKALAGTEAGDVVRFEQYLATAAAE